MKRKISIGISVLTALCAGIVFDSNIAAQTASKAVGTTVASPHQSQAPAKGRVTSPATAPRTAGQQPAPLDFDGNGRTDYSVVRNTGGSAGQLTWYSLFNGPGTFSQTAWGLGEDFIAPGDFDGDGKDDIALWRSGNGGTAGFYILHSGDSTFRFAQFGQSLDYPFVSADYTGDGKADPAIYREGTEIEPQSVFWYLASSGPLAGQPVAAAWGAEGDTPVPGDFTGDGKADFCVQRNVGGQGVFFIHPGTGGPDAPGADVVTYFGLSSDRNVPGDYDGDGKTDIAVTRSQSGSLVWYCLPSGGGDVITTFWGVPSDYQVQGDYDADGKTDIAVWRHTAPSTFYVQLSSGGADYLPWGLPSDIPSGYTTLAH